MALTNDQITAQNFKDFYEQIRPYLNGQVPTFANQFSRSDLYSTDEKIIGQWIDGKPLYQKALVKIVPQISSTSRQWVELFAQNELPGNIEKGIISAAYWCGDISNLSNMNTYKPFPIVDTSGIFVANVQYNNGIIQVLSNGSSWLTNNSFGVCIIFQYTKSTDSAIKVGTGTDYSTEEQVIGTWIDGKPLYQRTFSATVNQTTDGTKVSTIIVASYSALSIDMVYDSDVMIVNTGNDSFTRWACDRWGDSSQWLFNKLSRSDDFIIETNKASLGGLTCYATLRYTKTTD